MLNIKLLGNWKLENFLFIVRVKLFGLESDLFFIIRVLVKK